MNHQGAGLERRRLISNRRTGIFPGRRFAFGLAVAVASLAWPGALAAADSGSGLGPALVQATVIGGPSGSGGPQTLTVDQLGNCNPYPADDDNLGLYGAGGSYQSPAYLSGSSWSLATALSCGLRLSLPDITDVVVQRAHDSWETRLSNAELTQPDQYQDPNAPGALPVVSANGDYGGNNQYVRPWLGGTDDNAQDWVPAGSAPIVVQVYENGPPLNVTITPQQASSTSTTTTYSFSASVEDASGSAIPASALRWRWTFGDNSPTSTDAAPTHPYSISGRLVVSVQATDPSTGASGPGSTTLTIASSSQTGDSPGPGAGSTGPTGAAPTGQQNNGGGSPSAGSGSPSPGGGSPSGTRHGTTPSPSGHHGHRPKPPARTRKPAAHEHSSTGGSSPSGGSGGLSPGATTSGNGGSPSSSGAGAHGSQGDRTQPSSPSSQPATHGSTPHSGPAGPRATSPGGPVVRGLLISDVAPVAADRSPLVHAEPAGLATAPQVRRQITSSPVPTVLGTLAVLLLLGVGAGRELRWRFRPRMLRLGH